MSGRQSWMERCIAAALEVDDSIIDSAFKETHTSSKVKAFLGETSNTRQVKEWLYVMYQKPDIVADKKSVQDGDKQQIVVTVAENERLKERAIFFYKNTQWDLKAGKPIPMDLSKPCDIDLMMGEVSANVLDSFRSGLKFVYQPVLSQHSDWGSASPQQQREFMAGFGKFVKELDEGIVSMNTGIELKPIDESIAAIVNKTGVTMDEVSKKPEVVSHLVDLLAGSTGSGSWCETISAYLESGLDPVPKSRNQPEDPGPASELEHWRSRMQRINSITEQVKGSKCKFVFQFLHFVSKDASADSTTKVNVTNALRSWKSIDVQITESVNEAKDNVKYLTTLEKFIEPLYTGTPSTVVDTIPALLNAVKMVHTIARYYNTAERMTMLFTKITNQMILNCKACILAGGEHTEMWTQEPDTLIKNLESCLLLNEAYQRNYKDVKNRLMALPKGKQFEFSEAQIFGRFDLFCRRTSVAQFCCCLREPCLQTTIFVLRLAKTSWWR